MQTTRFLTQTIGDDYTLLISALYRSRDTAIGPKRLSDSQKKLAYARATALGLEPFSEICRWYGVISCCIQRANAKILRGEPVPGRHATPVPGGMFSLGRDLRLVTG